MGRKFQRYPLFFSSKRRPRLNSGLAVIGLVLILGLVSISPVYGELTVDDVHSALGADFELFTVVPGRPWVEEQHRYEFDGVMINCNFVAGRCLWIDYWSKGKQLDEGCVFEQLEKLFPGVEWKAVDQSGKLKRWLNKDEDRVTLRSTGFTLHMNEYIRNVLSRRAQWQF